MKKKRTSRADDWPALPLVEFAIGLAALMKKRNNMTQAELARRSGKDRSQISDFLAGNENMTIKTMALLARAVEGEIHIGVTPLNTQVRWVEDIAAETEVAPDLSRGWPRAKVVDLDEYRTLAAEREEIEMGTSLSVAPSQIQIFSGNG